ncbi:hypothetical protein AMECASPLE_033567 [Ameca splendens]|uniref:Secreted protein n=1 Tax=Ameca splendens TaxID=208324 RepID=A0ABV0Z5R6_9TELE
MFSFYFVLFCDCLAHLTCFLLLSVPPPPTSRWSLSLLVSPEDFLPPFDLEAPSSSKLTPTAACQSIHPIRTFSPSLVQGSPHRLANRIASQNGQCFSCQLPQPTP